MATKSVKSSQAMNRISWPINVADGLLVLYSVYVCMCVYVCIHVCMYVCMYIYMGGSTA
jgi:hypothetical protein